MTQRETTAHNRHNGSAVEQLVDGSQPTEAVVLVHLAAANLQLHVQLDVFGRHRLRQHRKRHLPQLRAVSAVIFCLFLLFLSISCGIGDVSGKACTGAVAGRTCLLAFAVVLVVVLLHDLHESQELFLVELLALDTASALRIQNTLQRVLDLPASLFVDLGAYNTAAERDNTTAMPQYGWSSPMAAKTSNSSLTPTNPSPETSNTAKAARKSKISASSTLEA